MSEPEFDRDNPDAESMFDFLAEEGEEKHRRKKRAAEVSERALPIIRKPVPVSESGPLLPPKPGAPVEPPPALTSGAAEAEDDLDFLDDMPAAIADGPRRQADTDQPDSDSNITRLDPRSRRLRGERPRSTGSGSLSPESGRVRKAAVSRDDEFDDLELNLDDAPEFHRNRQGVRATAESTYYDDEVTPRRGRWLVLALVLIAAGGATFLAAFPDDWRALVQRFGMGSDVVTGNSLETDPGGESLNGGFTRAASPMMQRFQEQLGLVEGLIADGALDNAEQALSSMDRTVYGYGVAEFRDLESRIAQLRSGVVVADQSAEQAEPDEAARVAAEQKAQAVREQVATAEQAARDADAKAAAVLEQAQREERARLSAQEENARLAAAEQSAREEQARVAADKAAQEERTRAAAQQAAREQQAAQELQAELNAETARLEAARQEQVRQEEQARLAALEARTSDWPSIEADRQATDRRIAEERAAVQRQQAREQRLVEAREREAALAAQAASQRPLAQPETTEITAVPAANSGNNAVTETRSIGDDELQTVYRRFIELQQAVSSRDINAVVGLTQRSGARVQQLMQIFENSTQIDARIRNVSTSNATGQIKGTLQINRIKRADGTFIEPPAALSSIPLSSQRDGDGWSAISW